jgi:hypothetical protein
MNSLKWSDLKQGGAAHSLLTLTEHIYHTATPVLPHMWEAGDAYVLSGTSQGPVSLYRKHKVLDSHDPKAKSSACLFLLMQPRKIT